MRTFTSCQYSDIRPGLHDALSLKIWKLKVKHSGMTCTFILALSYSMTAEMGLSLVGFEQRGSLRIYVFLLGTWWLLKVGPILDLTDHAYSID